MPRVSVPTCSALAACRAQWVALKKSIYGSTAGTKCNSYTTGKWTAEASDIMRGEHDYMSKYYEMRELSAKVMGCADYHPSPCVLVCPFEGC